MKSFFHYSSTRKQLQMKIMKWHAVELELPEKNRTVRMLGGPNEYLKWATSLVNLLNTLKKKKIKNSQSKFVQLKYFVLSFGRNARAICVCLHLITSNIKNDNTSVKYEKKLTAFSILRYYHIYCNGLQGDEKTRFIGVYSNVICCIIFMYLENFFQISNDRQSESRLFFFLFSSISFEARL